MLAKSLFDVWFDPDFYGFTRTVRDRCPYKVVNNDDGSTTLFHNVLGNGQDDVSVEIKPLDERHSWLEIKGNAKDNALIENGFKSRFKIKHDEVEEIIKTVKNGILDLKIVWKKVETPNIKIKDG